MTRGHTSYDQIDAPTTMREDAAAAGRALRLDRVSAAAAGPPGPAYAGHPREGAERDVRVDEAAARIANALHLHLD